VHADEISKLTKPPSDVRRSSRIEDLVESKNTTDPNYNIGDLVECHWEKTHDKYTGLIIARHGKGIYDIKHVVICTAKDGNKELQWDYNEDGIIDVSKHVHFDYAHSSESRKHGISPFDVDGRTEWALNEVQTSNRRGKSIVTT
jgi:hypothetical protein